MQYFQTFEYWQNNLVSLNNLREISFVNNQEKSELVFTVIEECSLKIDIGIKQKKGGGLLIMTAEQRMNYQIKPKLHIKGTTSNFQLNLSHSIYNKLVNLGKIFNVKNDEELQKPIEET